MKKHAIQLSVPHSRKPRKHGEKKHKLGNWFARAGSHTDIMIRFVPSVLKARGFTQTGIPNESVDPKHLSIFQTRLKRRPGGQESPIGRALRCQVTEAPRAGHS